MLVIEKAVVPIIKLIDSQTMVHIDISFNTSNGQEAAVLVKSYLGQFAHLKQLVMLLKYILNHRGLNEVWTGGLGSYALTLLVVNFLQQHPRLSTQNSGENLGILLLEFFELYGRNFNYEQNGIRVRDGGRVSHWAGTLQALEVACVRGLYITVCFSWLRSNRPTSRTNDCPWKQIRPIVH